MDKKGRSFNNEERYLNLIEAKPILPAQKNKVKIATDDMLRRRKDERLVKKAAEALGLYIKIDNFDDLEICGEFYQEGKRSHSIYKYWRSQEFHMQHEIKISRCGGDFKERFFKIHEICALNSIGILYPPVKSWPNLEVVLRMTICEYGFNEDVLDWAIATLDKCRDKIKSLL